jgi:hypothetical protein
MLHCRERIIKRMQYFSPLLILLRAAESNCMRLQRFPLHQQQISILNFQTMLQLMPVIPIHAGNNRRRFGKRRLKFFFLSRDNIQDGHFEDYFLTPDSALRNSAANCFAVSAGFWFPPIIFTHAEPTMTPSASEPTCLACSGVPIPNPTHTGADV